MTSLHARAPVKTAKLADICDIIIGRTPRRDTPEFWGGGLPWVSIADLNEHVVSATKETISHQGAIASRSRLLPAGTLLFSFKLTIGKMAFAGVDLYTNEAIAGIIPKDASSLDRDYLRFALSDADLMADSSHAVKGKTLNLVGLSAITVPVPPLPEQRRISATLREQMDAVGRARRGIELQVDAAGTILSSFLRDTFEGPTAHAYPTRRLGDLLFPRREVVHPKDSPSGPAVFVGLEHIESTTGRRIGSVPLEMSDLTGRKPRFAKGDIVYGYLRPYLNKVWIADFDGLCSVDQFVYQTHGDTFDTQYIAWFMRSPTYLRLSRIQATTGQLPRIGVEEVAAVELPYPNAADRQRIVARLNQYFETLVLLLSRLEETKKAIYCLPTALLREAFSGRL